MDYVRKQTYITREQDSAVKEVARQRGITEAEVLRQALDSWLATEVDRERDDPFAALIGLVEGPATVNHDDIYE